MDSCLDGINFAVPLKRYRCCNCRSVIKLKPEGYFERFQAPVATIRSCIGAMVTAGKTLKNISRQRQRHWFAALKKKAVALFGLGADLKSAFESLIARDIVPVSRADYLNRTQNREPATLP